MLFSQKMSNTSMDWQPGRPAHSACGWDRSCTSSFTMLSMLKLFWDPVIAWTNHPSMILCQMDWAAMGSSPWKVCTPVQSVSSVLEHVSVYHQFMNNIHSFAFTMDYFQPTSGEFIDVWWAHRWKRHRLLAMCHCLIDISSGLLVTWLGSKVNRHLIYCCHWLMSDSPYFWMPFSVWNINIMRNIRSICQSKFSWIFERVCVFVWLWSVGIRVVGQAKRYLCAF